jgi:protein gp37
MGDKSGIQWTEATWNPTTGCTHVSEGCTFCYAASLASGRLSHVPAYAGLAENGRFNGTVRLLPDRLDQPLRWTRPRMIFVDSMSDLFHDAIPPSYLARVFAVMAAAPRHTFQILTKRPGRMRSLMSSTDFREAVRQVKGEARTDGSWAATPLAWPLPNVWLGTSVEDQRWADIRIPILLDVPAAVRFLSCEPLLGPLDLVTWTDDWLTKAEGSRVNWGPSIDWVIVGGESGREARPMHPDWARSLRDQCGQASVPFFMKQAGNVLAREWGVPGKGADPAVWPESFPREYPDVAA